MVESNSTGKLLHLSMIQNYIGHIRIDFTKCEQISQLFLENDCTVDTRPFLSPHAARV